jgi:hypothetical protein
MDERIKVLKLYLPRNSYEKFKNKCDFYDISEKEVYSFLVEKFIDGCFDKELKLPID